MKKFLSILTISAFLLTSGLAFAFCPPGEDCKQVSTFADPNAGIHGYMLYNEDQGATFEDLIGGGATSDFDMIGSAIATGKEKVKEVTIGYEYTGTIEDAHCSRGKCYGYWQQREHEDMVRYTKMPVDQKGWIFLGTKRTAITELQVVKAAEGLAEGLLYPTLSTNLYVNFLRDTANVQELEVTSTTTLDIDGWASAEGNQGCNQDANISINGKIGAEAWGNTYVENQNAYAGAGAGGHTEVLFGGYESDQSTYGFLGFGANEAFVDMHSKLDVSQSIYTKSYISPDGTIAGNLAISKGGSAVLNLGSDATLFDWFAQDNVSLYGIESMGNAQQSALASNAIGYAAGSSSAAFSGAFGSVDNLKGFCGPDAIATGGGIAKAYGLNTVVQTGNSITVTSHQIGYATSGNSGPVLQDEVAPQ